MQDKTIITIVALILLAALQAYALHLGIDGMLLASVIGIFGVAIGIPVGAKYQQAKNHTDS